MSGAPMRRWRQPVQPVRGVALVAVLWIVAALSLVVMGVVQSTKQETRLVGQGRQVVLGDAWGQAAIQLVLQQIQARPEAFNRLLTVPVSYRGVRVDVQVMPMNGLIDVNSAPEPLLTQLFAVAGGWPVDAAGQLARLAIEMRQTRDAQGQAVGFDAPEDLLRLPGVDYTLYARLAGLVTAGRSGSTGKVNPKAAPVEVLAVLAQGDIARARQLAAAREADPVTGGDFTSLDAQFLDGSVTTRFRLTARVPLADGRWLLSSRGVDVRARTQEGLPWRVFSAERRLDAAGAPPVHPL